MTQQNSAVKKLLWIFGYVKVRWNVKAIKYRVGYFCISKSLALFLVLEPYSYFSTSGWLLSIYTILGFWAGLPWIKYQAYPSSLLSCNVNVLLTNRSLKRRKNRKCICKFGIQESILPNLFLHEKYIFSSFHY